MKLTTSPKCLIKYFIIFLLSGNGGLIAQTPSPVVQLSHYVFNEFNLGTIKMKSGEAHQQEINYNILTNEMIFMNGGKFMALALPENVDTVYINNREFIPIDNKFYEVLVKSGKPLLLEFTYSISEPGAATGYGGNATTTAATSFKSIANSAGAYQLKLPDNFKVVPGYLYWIRDNDELEKVTNAKSLIKIFPEKKDAINDAIKKNDLRLSKREDIVMLVQLIS